MSRKIVLLELNEVPWRVIDAFALARPRSSFARLLRESRQLTTNAADSAPLHPWCTWPTLHRGVANDVHGIDHFGQEHAEIDARWPPLWTLLERAGRRVGVFGALHTYPLPDDVERYAFFVPDTFAKGAECHPAAASVFQRFNLSMARASARNVSSAIDLPAAAAFLLRAPGLGVRLATSLALARQLLGERRAPHTRVRRRSFQSVLGFDLFDRLLRRTRPDFSNFFTNHVASSLHRYWAARFPEDYAKLGFDADWIARWSGEIDFAMALADDFLRRLVAFVDANPEYVLLLASSMGQAAHHSEPIRSQLYLRDVPRLMAAAGVPESAWERRPSMDPDTALVVAAPHVAGFRSFLEQLLIAGKPIEFEQKQAGFFNVALGRRNLGPQIDVRVGGRALTLAEAGFVNETIEDQAASSGNHVPEGCLLIYDPALRRGDAGREAVSSLDFAPFLLSHFGLGVPAYMRAPGAIAPL